jgi:hypothetical protein
MEFDALLTTAFREKVVFSHVKGAFWGGNEGQID